jgi:dynamin 1-like protein
LISKYANTYQEIIKGKYLQKNHQELVGGARINHIFFDIFQNAINEMNPFEHITDDDIRVAIGNSNGLSSKLKFYVFRLRSSLFVPEVAFENLVRIQIKKLLIPSLDCSHLVYEELRKIQNMINIPEIERY